MILLLSTDFLTQDLFETVSPRLSETSYAEEPTYLFSLSQSLFHTAERVLREKQDKELAKDLICRGIEYARTAKQDQVRRDSKYFVKELVMLQGIKQLLAVDRDDERCKPLIQVVFQSLKDDLSNRSSSRLAYHSLPDEEKTAENGGYIPTVYAFIIVIRELANVANLAGNRDTLIDLMNYCSQHHDSYYSYHPDLWDRCKKLIIEGVPQN